MKFQGSWGPQILGIHTFSFKENLHFKKLELTKGCDRTKVRTDFLYSVNFTKLLFSFTESHKEV